jgi:hypothetical protein
LTHVNVLKTVDAVDGPDGLSHGKLDLAQGGGAVRIKGNSCLCGNVCNGGDDGHLFAVLIQRRSKGNGAPKAETSERCDSRDARASKSQKMRQRLLMFWEVLLEGEA